MNEQLIGDLFVEAQRRMKGHGSKEFSEIFAELIVRECMAVANTYQNRGGNCYVDDMIAKHFGVEL